LILLLAHNPKVVGSNPIPATTKTFFFKEGFFFLLHPKIPHKIDTFSSQTDVNPDISDYY